jgi:lia operon protein LiaF
MIRSKWGLVFGLFLILAGIFIFLLKIFDWDVELHDILATLWPVALILLGAYLLWRNSRRRRRVPGRQSFFKVFGDLEIDGSQVEPEGLQAELGLGDIRIDLSHPSLAEKEHRITARIGIGDIKILVPLGIPVRARGYAIIGDVHLLSKTGSGLGSQVFFESEDYHSARRKISIDVHAGIGDIRVIRAE